MAEAPARLYLVTPVLDEPGEFPLRLAEACEAGDVAAVLLRLAPADERTLIKRVKAVAPAAQEAGAAVLVSLMGEGDAGTISARGGADGVHFSGSVDDFGEMHDRSKGDRILGVGNIRSKDDAMTFGEAGVDYLMFGEPRVDGSMPALESVLDRASWWAEIFETPCVAFAPSLGELARVAGTGAEFVALGDAVWSHPEGAAAGVRVALKILAEGPAR